MFCEASLGHFKPGCGTEDQLQRGQEKHVAIEEMLSFVQKNF